MGMFDFLYCDMPLPDGFKPEGKKGFQTKDLGNYLETYRITESGRLVLEKSLCDDDIGDKAYHGYITFYGIDGEWEDGHWIWKEYKAKFTDGQCVDISPVPDFHNRERGRKTS